MGTGSVVAWLQAPFLTTALYWVVNIKLSAVKVVVVFVTSKGVVQLSVVYCHLTTVPLLLPRVSVVLLVPEQTVVAPEIEPAIVAASTVTVVGSE